MGQVAAPLPLKHLLPRAAAILGYVLAHQELFEATSFKLEINGGVPSKESPGELSFSFTTYQKRKPVAEAQAD